MIKYLTYKGQQYPIRLSYRAFQGMRIDLKTVDLTKIDSMDPQVLESMLFHGLLAGAKSTEKEMAFTREQMEDFLDECFFDFLELIPEFFPQAKLGNALKNLVEPKETKAQQKKETEDLTT